MKRQMRISDCPKATLLLIALLFSACGGSAPSTSTTSTSSSPTPAVTAPSPSPKTEFEKDLQYVRNGQYTYIYVFSRKDGKPLESSDSVLLRTNAPQVVDWVTTEGGKKVIAGTNFNLEEGNLEVLKKRFVTENYSGK
jgi:hypothetical protein